MGDRNTGGRRRGHAAAASAGRAAPGARRCACGGSHPTTSASGAPSRRYRAVPAARSAADPGRAADARRRAHRAHGHRAAHGGAVGCHARRPGARHRRQGPSGCSRPRCSARRASTTSPSRSRRRCDAPGRWTVGARQVVEPDALPRAPMAGPVEEPFTIAFECSGNARCRGVRARPARLRGHARVRRDRARVAADQPQPGDRARADDHRCVQLRGDRLRAALELLASGALPLDALIEPDDVFLDELLPTMQRLATGDLAGKVMVRPEVTSHREVRA